jgi:hypothetical protein
MKIFSDYAAAQLRYLTNKHADLDEETSPTVRALKRALAQTTEPALKEGLLRAIAALQARGR